MEINEYFYHLKGEDNFVKKNHTHNEIELIQVINGSGTVLKNDTSYILDRQNLYIIDARKPHIVHPNNCDEYERNKIVIGADSFFAFCKEAGLEAVADHLLQAPPIPTGNSPRIEQLYETISTLCNSGTPENIGFAHGYLLELLHLCYSLSRDHNSELTQDTILQQILNVITKKNGVTSLSEISNTLHMNKYYLCHLFKDKTGITLTDYLSEKIYERAILLLDATSHGMNEIAMLCGFATSSSFTRFFKSKSGICPSERRKSTHAKKRIAEKEQSK
ncbi:MAG: AraC family transcriptional regulator [Clostridia bacterium]|nr:AraC family transcriptional regulator [Clostridia bacterium]